MLQRPWKPACARVRGDCASPSLLASRYNADMLFRHSLRLLTVAVTLVAASGISLSAQSSAHRGRKYKPPPPTSKIEVTVLRDDDSKPIENAAVIFHTVDMEGDKGNMELKTNEDGKSLIDILPIGATMRLQIIAKGYQTYGQDYKIEKAAMNVDVRMKRPARQYSIYEKHDQSSDSKKDDKNGDAGSQKDSPKDKPSDSKPPSDASPSQPQ